MTLTSSCPSGWRDTTRQSSVRCSWSTNLSCSPVGWPESYNLSKEIEAVDTPTLAADAVVTSGYKWLNSNLKSNVPKADFSDKFPHGVPRLLLPSVNLPFPQRITIVQDNEMPDGDDERCLDDLFC